MVKVLLQDIDNVLFPFKEKHAEFLLNNNLISKDLFSDFLNSNKPYLIDFLLEKFKQGNLREDYLIHLAKKYDLKAKIIFESFKEKKPRKFSDLSVDELNLIALFFATFDDFRESIEYQEGLIKETTSLNREIKKRFPEIKIVGITARENHIKRDSEEFLKNTKFTYSWNKNNNVGLDKIYFEGNKINAYNDLLKDENFKDAEVLCLIEDDPRHLEDFLKEGITCILISFDFFYNKDLVKDLKQKFGDKLKVAKNHLDATIFIKNIVGIDE